MISIILTTLGVAALYLYHVNAAMKRVPDEAQKSSPHHWTADEIKAAYKKTLENPIDITDSLPPKQSRRYIVVGGSGLVGSWIISHLLARGEDPASLRILDLLTPTQEILDLGVTFIKTNITDELAVSTAFEQPWPTTVAHLPLTVFHTAAVIRPFERLEIYLPFCSKVNVDGTKNVLNASKKSGATCFISTSSGSVSLHKPSFWIAPWEKLPRRALQILSDHAKLPERHDEFFGNYAVSKLAAERLVRSADDPVNGFRTGCIRPANGIYGIGSDASATITGLYLRKGGSPTWVRPVIQSFVNAENVSLAHLLYEARLLEQSNPQSTLPNIGGQSFVVTDPNPAISFNDIYTLLSTLSKTPVSFPTVQPLPFLLLSYLVEGYAYIQTALLPWLLPQVTGEILQIQPALFAITDVFCIADDERARKAPEEGGLGYQPVITTLEGMCRQLVDWNEKADAKKAAEIKGKVDGGLVSVGRNGVDVNIVVPEKKL
ncbi:3 beta-hydroxysteroid dehydrogenase/Delta 5--_4-isomerase [Penicillium rolfsii]|nr:3 beta-hydroxysteroid dehydrogenase/Delta 5-->4-isomerase [Penicillium rolfsii]